MANSHQLKRVDFIFRNENDWENYILLRVDGTQNGSKFKEHPLELGIGDLDV